MSLPDHGYIARHRWLRTLAATGLLATMFAVQACTVRPLYSDAPTTSGIGTNAELASISVKPVSTRYAQEVRNHMIFLLHRGQGQPASPRYFLDLGVTSLTEAAATVQVASEDEPTAGTVTMRSFYRVTDAASGEVVLSGNRQAVASFDVSRQEFAALRAERDAENRAARELAEFVNLAIAQDLARKSGS